MWERFVCLNEGLRNFELKEFRVKHPDGLQLLMKVFEVLLTRSPLYSASRLAGVLPLWETSLWSDFSDKPATWQTKFPRNPYVPL